MKCTINDIAVVISESIPNPAESGYDIFVGLEHYDSGEVKVTRYGSTENLVTAVKVFKKGDILLARRNVYLKRAGLVDFDGVTSGDSIVLRVKQDLSNLGINSAAVQKYLPFVLNTEEFWNYAEKYSDGTMSKRLSPKTLLQYEFEIPEDVESKNELLWAAFDAKESYRAMIRATDEMVKSQFIEMFGNPMVEEQKYPLKKLGDCCVINPKRSKIALSDTDPVSFVPMPSVSEEGYLQDVSDAEYGSVKKGFTYFENGDVLFAKITPCMENGKGAIAHDLTNGIGMGSTEFHVLRPLKGRSNSYWLLTLTRLPEFRDRAAHNMSGTGGQQRVRAAFLENFMIGLPPIEKQIELETICRVADKSKFELKQAIEKIDKVMRALMQ